MYLSKVNNQTMENKITDRLVNLKQMQIFFNQRYCRFFSQVGRHLVGRLRKLFALNRLIGCLSCFFSCYCPIKYSNPFMRGTKHWNRELFSTIFRFWKFSWISSYSSRNGCVIEIKVSQYLCRWRTFSALPPSFRKKD